MGIKDDYLHSSKSMFWETSDWLFVALNKEFEFTIDVCADEKK
jgi:hypothetical protein